MKKRVVIVGAGIVGLASAYKLSLARPDWDIRILEKEPGIAKHQTGHNSGVIHSGIYYKPGSLKALNCKKGYAELLEFCQQHKIQHEITGKIIAAATAAERPLLDSILARGLQNGLTGIRKIGAAEAREIEPNVRCTEAIWVPQTGIIHYPDVAATYQNILTKSGATFHFQAKVSGIVSTPDGATVVQSTQGDFEADLLINCTGLYADQLVRMTDPTFEAQHIPFRGEYYVFKPEREGMIRNLIYPVPNPNFPFLGVHFTRMAKGGVEAGPNAVLAFGRESYHRSEVHWGELGDILRYPGFRKIAARYWRDGLGELWRSYSKAAFVRALQRLVPAVQGSDLVPGGAGVRAQLCLRDGSLVDDFHFVKQRGILHVVNAPSPAATASLAIGAEIVNQALAL